MSDVLKYLSSKLNEEIKIMSDDMALGNAKDFGSYQYACGVIRGLMVANSAIADIAQRMEEDE
jgi:hypothetical protein